MNRNQFNVNHSSGKFTLEEGQYLLCLAPKLCLAGFPFILETKNNIEKNPCSIADELNLFVFLKLLCS